MLFNIHTGAWDDELLALLACRATLLPQVVPSSDVYGDTRRIDGVDIPIAGIAGDQQAALFGQACLAPGMAKNTYGTGCFMLMNTGRQAGRFAQQPVDHCRLAARRAYRIRAGRQRIHRRRGRAMAARRPGDHPDVRGSRSAGAQAFRTTAASIWCLHLPGLGAPHWDPYARGAILGLTRGATAAHIARAALEASHFQSADVLAAMEKDAGITLTELRVDGGATATTCCCSSRPTSWVCPSCGPKCARRPRSARPISQDWRSASGTAMRISLPTGRPTADSNRRCRASA